MKTEKIVVSGMSCSHCVEAVESAVRKISGVVDVSVHLESGEVDVQFAEGTVDVRLIHDAIEDQGFDVV